jgi:hypothetical protein
MVASAGGATQGAPNVLLIMTDDVGFGSPSTFGGIIPTPNLDSIAKIEFDFAYEGQGLEPRWGRSAGRESRMLALCVLSMKTIDDEILGYALKFAGKATSEGKPFFLWLNPTRMHVVTHLSDKYEKMRIPENGWSSHFFSRK